jgi:hypothetical protein
MKIVFENKTLSTVLGPTGEDVTAGETYVHSKLYNLYFLHNINTVIKSGIVG